MRVMHEEFRAAISELCAVGRRGAFLAAPVRLRSSVSESDRRLVSEHLTAQQWRTVESADLRPAVCDSTYRRFARVTVDPKIWGLPTILRETVAGANGLATLAGVARETAPPDARCRPS